MAIIRTEYKGDFDDIREINEEAFNQPEEADLVESLRKNGQIIVSLVAEQNSVAIGHILFSKAHIEGHKINIAALGPVAVLPEEQGAGIGSLLVREGFDECLSQGYDVVIVLGNPDFYSKFGFKPASEFGINSQWDNIPNEAFMALELHAGALDNTEGTAHYPEEFNTLA